MHCDTLFETSDKAKEYVLNGDLISLSRPALYGEPMLLKYGDEKNPNIILAIGSVGDGVTQTRANKVFFIDFADIEKSINEIKDNIETGDSDVKSLKDLVDKVILSCGLSSTGEYVSNQDDDTLKLAKSLYDADKLLSEAIKSIQGDIVKIDNFNVKDSNTITHTLTNETDGKVLTSEVKLSDKITIDNYNYNNIIIKQNDGLFVNVRLTYDDINNKLIFGVNNEIKEISLPKENHVISGYYDTKTESLVLTFKENISDGGKTLSIDLSKLIGEWTVLGENTDTPVVLTKTPVKSDDILHGADSYQDILKADIRIPASEYKPYNILQKTEDNKYLYVDGVADNIKYLKNGKVITVKQALDEVDCNVSTHSGNIIYRKEDGIFANVELEYSYSKNTLKFTKTTKDGDVETQEFTLNNITFLENIYYDSLKEEIVVQYKDASGEVQEIRVPVSSLFEEWEVDNTNHTVTLTKSEHQTVGKDKLSADVNIASTSDNILRVVNHGLHVKGTSDNIKHGSGTVKDALDLLNGAEDTEGSVRNLIKKESDERKSNDATLLEKIVNNESAIEANKSSIQSEKDRATSEEQRIEGKFDSEISKQSTVNNQITSAVTKIQEDLNSEINRSTNKDSELSGLISENTNLITSESNRAKAVEALLQKGIETNSESITSETERATAAEKANSDAIAALDKKTTMTPNNTGTINLTKTVLESGDGYTLSGQVNVSQELGNIINSDGSALKATVDLVYDGSKNTLTLKTSNNADKTFTLNAGSIITSIRYESSTKELVITYQTANGETQEVRVNVSDLFNEVTVENPAENAVTLKMEDKLDGSKVITADVNVSSEPNNLLQKVTGNLYVSNAASGIKFENSKSLVEVVNDINQTISDNKNDSDTKYSELNGKITLVESKVDTNTSKISALESKDTELESSIQTVKDNLAQEITDRTSGDTAINNSISSLDSKLTSEVERAINKENELSSSISQNKTLIDNLTNTVEQNRKDAIASVKNTETVSMVKELNLTDSGYILSSNVNISQAEGNIIKPTGSLFASVDLQYNSATNVLTLLTSNNASKEIKLSVGSIIKSITYDSDNKQLVIIYIDENQEEKTVNVPVSDLYNEWVVEDRDSSVIKLTKEDNSSQSKPDVLRADLKLATPDDNSNLLQNLDGNLYASNRALKIILSDHVGTNVEAAIVNLNGRIEKIEESGVGGDFDLNTEDTQSIDLTFTKTSSIPSLKADVKISSQPDNQLTLKSDGLYVLEDYDFGVY